MKKNTESWIKIHKKILKWGWYEDTNVFRVFMHLLLTANWEDKGWKGILVKRGQTITGRNKLSKTLGISQGATREAIKKLKTTNEITVYTTNRYSIITIVKYDDYQYNENILTNNTTNNTTDRQPTDNQQTTTPIEYKNNKNIKNKEEGGKKFQDPVNQVIDIFYNSYGKGVNYYTPVQRAAVEEMIGLYTLDKVLDIASLVCAPHPPEEYFPFIGTPKVLLVRWRQVLNAIDRLDYKNKKQDQKVSDNSANMERFYKNHPEARDK